MTINSTGNIDLDLKKELEAINDYTDIRKVRDLREKVLWLNTINRKNNEIFDIARQKGLI